MIEKEVASLTDMKDTLNKRIEGIDSILPENDEDKRLVQDIQVERESYEKTLSSASEAIQYLKDREDIDFYNKNNEISLQ